MLEDSIHSASRRVIPVVVISLARAAERRAAVERNLGALGVPFRFFDAVDGAVMCPQAKAALDPRPYAGHKGRALLPGEIGCAASYQAVLRDFLDGPEPMICIAEDDAVFTADARPFLDARRLVELMPFGVLRLFADAPRQAGFSRIVWKSGSHAVHAPLRVGFFTLCQIFTRTGAEQVLTALVPLSAPLDNLVYRDNGVWGLRVLELRPPVVFARATPSTIRADDCAKPTPARPDPRAWLGRKWSLLARRLRAPANYLLSWGARGLLRLRPYR